jgi:MbtH protein
MATADREDPTIYKVVINHEEQYLVLPEAEPIPPGWHDAGHTGTHDTCLQFLKRENVGRRGRPRKD